MNFILLIGEDTGRHLACYGENHSYTPNLDQFAKEGCRFTQAFCHAPVCAPSRSSLVTGQYPWSLGVHQMRSTLRNPPRMFTHELVDTGYTVLWPTKLDFNFDPTPGWCTGFDEWWKTGLPKDRPFFAYRNISCTHESCMWTDTDNRNDWVEPVTIHRADPEKVKVPPYLPDLPEVRLQIARYLDNLTQQDLYVAECLKALDESGQADDTMVIYLTDHGRGLPREKRWCYEAGIHLPLIIRWPGKIAPESLSDAIVSWVDIGPTILTLAGCPVPAHYQGQPFLSAIDKPPRRYHFAGRDRMDESYDCQRTCRSSQWLYVHNFFPEIPTARRNHYQECGPAVGAMRDAWADQKLTAPADIWFSTDRCREELFNVQEDPHCLHNLASDPGLVEILAEHRAALREHLMQVGDWGSVPEQAMVNLGMVDDRFDEFNQRLGQLPPQHEVEPVPSSIEMPYRRPSI